MSVAFPTPSLYAFASEAGPREPWTPTAPVSPLWTEASIDEVGFRKAYFRFPDTLRLHGFWIPKHKAHGCIGAVRQREGIGTCNREGGRRRTQGVGRLVSMHFGT